MAKRKWNDRLKKFGRPGSVRAMELREQRAERHAKLVAERVQDPQYAHRLGRDGDTEIIEVPGELAEMLDAQIALFEEKFGRPPGPDDPLFFDPNADTPQHIDAEQSVEEYTQAVMQAMAEAGLDPAIVHAFGELGYIVTEQNEHMFSLAELDEWEAAVARHRGGRAAFGF